MNYEEALEYAESYMTVKGVPINSKEATRCIVEALEKQIPKKPIKDGIDRMCPICECYVGYVDAMCNVKLKYCTECGQKIDWSEVE